MFQWLASLSAAVATTVGAQSCNTLSNDVVNIGKGTHCHAVKLMKFDPDRMSARKIEFSRLAAEKDYSKGIKPFSPPSNAVDLAMGNVPVLNQGSEGTCVTFSSTAALDVLIAKGDYVSQQCSLALDASLGNDYWEGANYPSQVIQPLQVYGVVPTSLCPSKYPDLGEKLTPIEYQQLTDVPASDIVSSAKYEYSPTANLANLKTALASGHRVLMAFVVNSQYQEAVQGFDISILGQPYSGGLWACKQGGSMSYCGNSLAGHEVLVIGYDDTQQLLKIRNSWGTSFGDHGDYYMTYTFFSSQAVDMTSIW